MKITDDSIYVNPSLLGLEAPEDEYIIDTSRNNDLNLEILPKQKKATPAKGSAF